MKGKRFYVLMIGLLLIGIGSVFFHRQQKEQRILAFESYEISAITGRIDELFNEEKTDIAQDLSEETLEELEILFEELNKKEFSRRSRARIEETKDDFLTARSMLQTEKEVAAIFVEPHVVDQAVSEEHIDDLEYRVLNYENMTNYVDRNIEWLAYGRKEIVAIDRAREFVARLFDEEENVLETVSREEEEEARNLIAAIQNKEVKDELLNRVEMVQLALADREEQLALETKINPVERKEEVREEQTVDEGEETEEIQEAEEPQYTDAPVQPWVPSTPSTAEESNNAEVPPATTSEPEESNAIPDSEPVEPSETEEDTENETEDEALEENQENEETEEKVNTEEPASEDPVEENQE